MADATGTTSTAGTTASATNTTGADNTPVDTTPKATDPATTEPAKAAENTVLSSEEIQKLIQKTVDTRTADLGKKIGELQKENAQLKKANMTAEEIQKAEREEFEKQKAEVELQKRQIFAQGIVAKAGFGDDVEAVVDFVLGDTDDKTSERLKAFTDLFNKLVAAKVDETFKTKGRTPNGATQSTETKTTTIAEQLGKNRAEQQKKSNDVLQYYTGGNK